MALAEGLVFATRLGLDPDAFLKVAQGSEEPVDLVEASVNEAVRLIRGRKGTEVRLTVQKPSGRVQVISITRDVVVVEETYAKSATMTPAAGKKKVGYINLPAFYHDFNNSRGRTASADVRDELEKLVEALLQREELLREEIDEILGKEKPGLDGKAAEEDAPTSGVVRA